MAVALRPDSNFVQGSVVAVLSPTSPPHPETNAATFNDAAMPQAVFRFFFVAPLPESARSFIGKYFFFVL